MLYHLSHRGFLIINEKSLAFQRQPDPIPVAGEEATFKQIWIQGDEGPEGSCPIRVFSVL